MAPLSNQMIQKSLDDVCKKYFEEYTIELTPQPNGTNNFGVLYKCIVSDKKGTSARKDLRFFLKVMPLDGIVTQVIDQNTVFAHEIYFYNGIIARFNQLWSQVNGAKRCFEHLPRCMGFSDVPNEQFVILDDMTALGFRIQRDGKKLMDYHHSKLVMQQLGQFHGYSLTMKHQRPEEFAKLIAPITERVFLEKHRNIIEPCVQRGFECLKGATDVIVNGRYAEFTSNFLEECMDCVDSTTAGLYAVINHGDCWNDNILFSYTDEGRPKHMCLIDYQMIRYCSPINDIVHFLYTNTEKTMRDQHFDQLINAYYRSLCYCVRCLGSDPRQVFPRIEFDRQIQTFGRYGLCSAILNLLVYMSEGPEHSSSIEVCFNNELNRERHELVSPNTEYMRRLRDVIVEMVERKYI